MKQPDCGCIMNTNCRLHPTAPELFKAVNDFLVALRTRGREGSVRELVKLMNIAADYDSRLHARCQAYLASFGIEEKIN